MRNELMIGSFLRQLFDAAMQETHDRRGLHQPFPFQLKNDLEHAVRAGVLGAHVEKQFLGPQRR